MLLPNVPEFLSTINGIWMAGAAAVAISPLSVPEKSRHLSRRPVAGWLSHSTCSLRSCGTAPTSRKQLSSPRCKTGSPAGKSRSIGSPGNGGFSSIPATAGPRVVVERGDASFQSRFRPNGITDARRSGVPACDRRHDGPSQGGRSQPSQPGGKRDADSRLGRHAMGNDSVLAVIPFFHSYGLSSCALAGVSMAATIIMHHRFVPETVLQLIEKYEPTVMPAVPAMLVGLNDLFGRGGSVAAQPAVLHFRRAPLDQRVAEEFSNHTGATVVEGFGLSEASPVTHVGPLDGSARPGQSDCRCPIPMCGSWIRSTARRGPCGPRR